MRNEQRRLEPAPRIVESRECWGCGKPSGEENYCRKCAPEVQAMEIESLEQIYRASGGVEATQADLKVFRVRRFCAKWLWVPNLVFVGGAALCLGWKFGEAFVEWIKQGGMQ